MPQPNVETWVQGVRIGQYLLVRELARGGMGEIWLARQTATAGFDRLVVLKRVLSSQDEDPANLTMFLDEARIASQLHHPNIVQIFELGQHGSSAFLVMEYLQGQTVSRLARRMVESSGRVPPGLAVSIVAAAAKGLGYAHRRKDLDGRPLEIVHRDVSPQNLFVTYDGQVKVLDFGIALAAGRVAKTSTGSIKGKVAYMSPEQALGEPLTGTSDVYALGIVLFEALTGTRYYGKTDEIGILRQLATRTPAVIPSSRGAIDRELEGIVLRALAPDAAERFADGQVFFETLDGWLRRHPVATGELEGAMTSAFAEEMKSLGEVHRLATKTPVSSSNASMPNAQPREPAAPRRTLLFVAGSVVVLLLVFSAAYGLGRAGQTSPDGKAPAPSVPTVVSAGEEDAGTAVDAGESVLAAAPQDAGALHETGESSQAPLAVSEPTAPKEARPAAAMGRLTLDTEPWTGVFLGKRKLGDTPLIELALPAGSHRLRLINAEEHVDTVIEVVIKARETTEKRLAF